MTWNLPTKAGRPLRGAMEKRPAMKRLIEIVPQARAFGSLVAALQGGTKA